MLLIQAMVVAFSLFAMTRAVVRHRQRVIGVRDLLLWIAFWTSAAALVLRPQATQWFAMLVGVGRGADAVFYVAIVGLSYAVFRLYLKTCAQDQEITRLVRAIALKAANSPE